MFDKRDPHRFELAAELAAIERELAGLTLPPPQVDRDRLMFDAGRAAERTAIAQRGAGNRIAWLWPTATGMLAAATILLSAMLLWRHEPARPAQHGAQVVKTIPPPAQSVPQVTQVTHSVDPWRWASRPMAGYLAMRHIALTHGISSIDPETFSANGRGTSWSEAPRHEPATVRDLLNDLLPPDQTPARS